MVIEENLTDNVRHAPAPRRAFIGHPKDFWIHTTRDGFDLTRPSRLEAPDAGPRLQLQTTTSPITLAPSKTALIIIDMQNFFLSESLDRPRGAGHLASENLLRYAIPAAREAGIQIVWLCWGLTEQEVETFPASIKRAFGFHSVEDGNPIEPEPFAAKPHALGADKFGNVGHHGGKMLLEHGKSGFAIKGVGAEVGEVTLPSGETVAGGGLLMRAAWNTKLYPPLDAEYQRGKRSANPPDVWIHKNRMSGLWGASTPLQEFLDDKGIRSLLFSGINTDHCVSATYQDAFNKGYDCILLSDGCGTNSPDFAQQTVEFNAANAYGFALSCERFANGVDHMSDADNSYVYVN